MKVLVVEDEPLIRDIFAEFLELLGYEADVTANGREGLKRFDPLVHKIVITDFLMPGLTGMEIAGYPLYAGAVTCFSADDPPQPASRSADRSQAADALLGTRAHVATCGRGEAGQVRGAARRAPRRRAGVRP